MNYKISQKSFTKPGVEYKAEQTISKVRLSSAFSYLYQMYGEVPKSLKLFCLFLFFSFPQMSWNGSDQLEKAMEEVLDDDDEVKVEKSCVEQMEKHKELESQEPVTQPTGIHLFTLMGLNKANVVDSAFWFIMFINLNVVAAVKKLWTLSIP